MTLNFEQARDYVIIRLENELSPLLAYHSAYHTLQEVVPAVVRLASMEKVGGEDRLLLLTAAYYHDLGFIRQRQGHEAVSIEIAKETLPTYGYSENQIDIICGIIRATSIPQSPTNLLEMIMADADLDYLGHENFWNRSRDLRQELKNFGTQFSDVEWYTYQIQFIQAHQYFTASAKSTREAVKQQHLAEIQKQFALANQNK
jgi:uncharacterized protein